MITQPGVVARKETTYTRRKRGASDIDEHQTPSNPASGALTCLVYINGHNQTPCVHGLHDVGKVPSELDAGRSRRRPCATASADAPYSRTPKGSLCTWRARHNVSPGSQTRRDMAAKPTAVVCFR